MKRLILTLSIVSIISVTMVFPLKAQEMLQKNFVILPFKTEQSKYTWIGDVIFEWLFTKYETYPEINMIYYQDLKLLEKISPEVMKKFNLDTLLTGNYSIDEKTNELTINFLLYSNSQKNIKISNLIWTNLGLKGITDDSAGLKIELSKNIESLRYFAKGRKYEREGDITRAVINYFKSYEKDRTFTYAKDRHETVLLLVKQVEEELRKKEKNSNFTYKYVKKDGIKTLILKKKEPSYTFVEILSAWARENKKTVFFSVLVIIILICLIYYKDKEGNNMFIKFMDKRFSTFMINMRRLHAFLFPKSNKDEIIDEKEAQKIKKELKARLELLEKNK